MAKQIIRLTESDLHMMVESAVKNILLSEEDGDWAASFHKWRDSFDKVPNDELDRMNKDWVNKSKAAIPDVNQRRAAVNKEFKKRDVAAGKTNDKEYWRNYDKSFDND